MSEIVDIVDKHDNVIGTDTRKNAHKSGKLHRGIHIILLNSKGILLPTRSAKRDAFPRTYDCSISEHVQHNEAYKHAAMRGAKEELGVSKPKLKKLIKFSLKYGPSNYKISTLYECVYNGKVKLDKEEVERIAYVSKGKLKQMLVKNKSKFAPWTYQILRWYLGMPSKVKIL
ncbi:MAG TPA: NUDIX domain-containing protein [Candidatus Acidoferrum sp.]|nr:NUDIX domain-containing protein [Candidatus Acidoferrum sp.]